MDNITGPPVIGDNFFGREKELDYNWKRIASGNNLIFPSPRRVGKTSFALRLLEVANLNDWQTVSINLEKISTEEEFIALFISKLQGLSFWEKTKEKGAKLLESFGKIKPSATVAGVKVEVEWQSGKKDIYSQLSSLLDHNEPTLIFLDELTVLLISIVNRGDNGLENAADFLHWLRAIRIEAGSKIKWIYCSSVGIENFIHRHKISDTMNDVHNYELKSFSKDESIVMLKLLSTSTKLKLGNDILTAIVDKLEYYLPFFLQITFEKIDLLISTENLPVEKGIVDIAYNALIEEAHFNTWIERIDKQYEGLAAYAFILLKHVCQVKEGVSRESLINVLVAAEPHMDKAEETVGLLLYMLKNDGYLIEENRLYRFRSPLLRDFWFNRFVK